MLFRRRVLCDHSTGPSRCPPVGRRCAAEADGTHRGSVAARAVAHRGRVDGGREVLLAREAVHLDRIVAGLLGTLQQIRLGGSDDSGLEGGRDQRGRVLLGKLALLDGGLDLRHDALGFVAQAHGAFEAAERVLRVERREHGAEVAVALLAWDLHGTSHTATDLVGRHRGQTVQPAPRCERAAEEPRRARHLEVRKQAIEGLLDLSEGVLHRPVEERAVFLGLSLGLEAAQDGCAEVHPREDVGEAASQLLLPLEVTAEGAHGDVSEESERCARPRHLAPVGRCWARDRRAGEPAASER